MAEWIEDRTGLSFEEAGFVVGVLAFVVPLLLLAIPPIRRATGRAWRRLALATGFTRRRYTRWFTRKHGILRNIYLNRVERLDLGGTYVSLSFYSREQNQENRVLATRVLAEADNRRLLIVGDPGTGKSTLLRAYGTGILRSARSREASDLRVITPSGETPFFVSLRHFARHADGTGESLRRYLVEEILEGQAGVKSATRLFERLCAKKRCLVLLDGLDEVPDERYGFVRDAIIEFAVEDTATGAARIVLSCRRQNFLRIRGDWVPSFTEHTHALAPLRDTEILRFLEKRRGEFTDSRTPETFFAAIKASRSMDLHRAPLILTVSLGLYLHLAAYDIPSSVARFYQEMIRELLTRHDFRADSELLGVNRFNADDKYRFLREFALAMANRPGQFEDFSYAEILDAAARLAPRMAKVRPEDIRDFVAEVIDRSGLLTRISDEDEYIFAHRSIHEYLAAVQLARKPEEGADLLLRLASDSDWRQVIVFFAAIDHDYVDAFVGRLAALSAELAGHCIAVASSVTTEVASPILAELRDRTVAQHAPAVHLLALMSATRAQKEEVRTLAVTALYNALQEVIRRPNLAELLAPDTEGLLQLLDALVETGAPHFISLVARLAALVPDDEPRLVGPLWACLAISGAETDVVASSAIVHRLLRMAVDPVCFTEIQAQPAFRPSFVTPDLRKRAYPFDRGLDPASNLVTLLTWAGNIDFPPEPRRTAPAHGDQPAPNRFMEAWSNSPVFLNLERDHFSRAKSFRPYPYMRFVCLASLVGAALLAIKHGIQDGWQGFEIADLGRYSFALHLVAPAASIVWAAILNDTGALRFKGAGRRGNRELYGANLVFYYFDVFAESTSDRGVFVWDGPTFSASGFLASLLSIYSLAASPLAAELLVAYFVITFICCMILFWVPAGIWCAPGRRIILRKPNKFEDVYDDPRSRHWLGLGATS